MFEPRMGLKTVICRYFVGFELLLGFDVSGSMIGLEPRHGLQPRRRVEPNVAQTVYDSTESRTRFA